MPSGWGVGSLEGRNLLHCNRSMRTGRGRTDIQHQGYGCGSWSCGGCLPKDLARNTLRHMASASPGMQPISRKKGSHHRRDTGEGDRYRPRAASPAPSAMTSEWCDPFRMESMKAIQFMAIRKIPRARKTQGARLSIPIGCVPAGSCADCAGQGRRAREACRGVMWPSGFESWPMTFRWRVGRCHGPVIPFPARKTPTRPRIVRHPAGRRHRPGSCRCR